MCRPRAASPVPANIRRFASTACGLPGVSLHALVPAPVAACLPSLWSGQNDGPDLQSGLYDGVPDSAKEAACPVRRHRVLRRHSEHRTPQKRSLSAAHRGLSYSAGLRSWFRQRWHSAQKRSRAGSRWPQSASPLVGIALVNLATLTWATNIALGRVLRGDIGPLTLAASRYAITSVLFAAILTRRPAEGRSPRADRGWLLGMALSGVALFAPTLYLGLRYTTAVNATLINSTAPLITGLLALLLIHEPMQGRQVVGAVLGLAGVALLISGGSSAFWRSASVNPGDLILLGGATLWAVYSVLGRRVMRHRSALSASALSAILGTPLLILAAIWELRTLPVNVTAGLILAILYIGAVPSLVGLLAWNEGVRRLGASGAMVFYNTLPLYGALIGLLFLKEPFGPVHLVGGALIVGGGIWAARTR